MILKELIPLHLETQIVVLEVDGVQIVPIQEFVLMEMTLVTFIVDANKDKSNTGL